MFLSTGVYGIVGKWASKEELFEVKERMGRHLNLNEQLVILTIPEMLELRQLLDETLAIADPRGRQNKFLSTS